MASAIPGETLHTYSLSARFRPLDHVIWTHHGDATVILDAERGHYYTLNEVGGRIWDLVAAREPMVEVLRLLKEEYDAPPETLETEAFALLTRLVQIGLLEAAT